MNDSLATIDSLLREVVAHLKAGTRADRSAAAAKLERLSAVAATLALTLKLSR